MNKILSKNISFNKNFGIFVFLLVVLSLPVSIMLTQNQQDIRKQAAGPTSLPTKTISGQLATTPLPNPSCQSCQAQGSKYLCFDSLAHTFYCSDEPQEFNVRCTLCAKQVTPLPTRIIPTYKPPPVTVTPKCRIRPLCDISGTCDIPEPDTGWCPSISVATSCIPRPPCADGFENGYPARCMPPAGVVWCPITPTPTITDVEGDINGDGKVNLGDFGILLSCFRATHANCTKADLDGDGEVNEIDFNILLRNLLFRKR